MNVSAVDTQAFRHRSRFPGCQHHQGFQIATQNLGGEVLGHRLPRQSGNVLEVEPVLEPFEGLLNAPEPMIEVAKCLGWETGLIQGIGHQHPDPTARRLVAYQADGLRRGGATEVGNIAMIRRPQCHDLFGQPGAQEVTYAGEAIITALLDAHAEVDATLIQQRHQPASGITTIEQQHVVLLQALEALEKHLPLPLVGAVQGCGQHHLCPRQVETEGNLIEVGGAWHMAGSQAETDGRAIASHQAQPPAARHPAGLLGPIDQVIVERRKRTGRQLGPSLGKGLFGDGMVQLRLLQQVTKELIQLSLDAFTQSGEHDGDQRRQRQLTLTGEGVGMCGVPRHLAEVL